MRTDPDYTWLKSHLEITGSIKSRETLAKDVSATLMDRIRSGRLPYTLGIFGGWGTGKTTFLAQLAENLENAQKPPSIVYFNSWKYAGFMEIVPALIYKILFYGLRYTKERSTQAAMRVLLTLGKDYSDAFGDWAQSKIGVNPTKLFREVYDLTSGPRAAAALVSPKVVHAYYTQVDKAQDELEEALGKVTPGEPAPGAIVVLIDELDRCDPDEAFAVIKQMRVLFGMRSLPIAFVVCANPEPIGLAIKHRYGFEGGTTDYEARRILEKFVDGYQELGKGTSHRSVVEDLWKKIDMPWLVAIDEENVRPPYEEDTIKNVTAPDIVTSASPLLGNLRLLRKSLEYVSASADTDNDFIWSHWLLEIAEQLDPGFRQTIRSLSGTIQNTVVASYRRMQSMSLAVERDGARVRLIFRLQGDGPNPQGNTLFANFHGLFWVFLEEQFKTLKASHLPADAARVELLRALLGDTSKMEFLILVGLLPFSEMPDFIQLTENPGGGLGLSDDKIARLAPYFGSALS